MLPEIAIAQKGIIDSALLLNYYYFLTNIAECLFFAVLMHTYIVEWSTTLGISTAEYYPNYAGLATETFAEEPGTAGTSLLGAASSGLFGSSNPPNSSLLSDLFVDTKEFDR